MSFIRIDKEQYHVVKQLLSGEESVFTPCPLSILEGIIDGIVFVDIQDHPQCAAVMSNDLIGGRLIGRASDTEFNNEFVSMMKEHFFSNDGTSSDFRLFWSAASETWDELIFRIFGYKVFRINRTQFRFDRDTFESFGPVEVCNGMQRIDAGILKANESLRKEIVGIWGSIEKYLQYDTGWISMSTDGKVIGRCNTAFFGEGLAEISIQVNKSVRGTGLGFQLARNYIKDCLDRGVIPNWTCDTQNIPSIHLAQKLGFVKDRSYYLFASVYTPMFHEPTKSKKI